MGAATALSHPLWTTRGDVGGGFQTRRMTRQRKSTRDSKRRVAGEDPRVLLQLLARFGESLVQNTDGSFSGDATYSKEEGPPLIRALMRVEAELLLSDAHRLRTQEDGGWRTPDQRSADALGLLVVRCAIALGQAANHDLMERYRTGRRPDTPRGVSWCA